MILFSDFLVRWSCLFIFLISWWSLIYFQQNWCGEIRPSMQVQELRFSRKTMVEIRSWIMCMKLGLVQNCSKVLFLAMYCTNIWMRYYGSISCFLKLEIVNRIDTTLLFLYLVGNLSYCHCINGIWHKFTLNFRISSLLCSYR